MWPPRGDGAPDAGDRGIAPNGTMKTSFAKTLNLISKDDSKSIGDKVYPDRPTNFNILADGNAIVSNSILVVNAEDNNYDSSSKISSFIYGQKNEGDNMLLIK